MANSMSSVRNVEMAPNSTVARSGGSRVFLTLLLWLFLGWSTVMAKRVGAARRAGPTSHEKRELWLVDYTKVRHELCTCMPKKFTLKPPNRP